jgi:hypothetical protein
MPHKLRSLTSYSVKNNRLKKKGTRFFKDVSKTNWVSETALHCIEGEPLFKNLKTYYILDAIFGMKFFVTGFYID